MKELDRGLVMAEKKIENFRSPHVFASKATGVHCILQKEFKKKKKKLTVFSSSSFPHVCLSMIQCTKILHACNLSKQLLEKVITYL